MFFRGISPSETTVGNKEVEKIKIAIMDASTGGLFTAISLIKKFGEKVDVFVFEKHPYFDLEKAAVKHEYGKKPDLGNANLHA